MSKKPEAISDELKLTLTTARLLRQQLVEHGHNDQHELAAALKPFEEKTEEQHNG